MFDKLQPPRRDIIQTVMKAPLNRPARMCALLLCTHRQSSGRHLDRQAAEQHRREAGTRADVIVSERVLAVDQQLAAVIAVVVRQLRPKQTKYRRRDLCTFSAMTSRLL